VSGKATIVPKGDGTYMVMWWEQVGDRSDMYGRDFPTREAAVAFVRGKGMEVESEAEGAAREAETALDPMVALMAGIAYAQAEHWDDAARAFESAARRNPNDAQTRRHLGVTYCQLDRLDEGVRELQAAVRLDPQAADAHHHLGIAYLRQKRWEEAARALQEVLRLEPDSVRACRELGLALLKGGELSRAAEEFERYLQQQADDAEAHFLLACAYGRLTNIPKSLREARRAVDLGYGPAQKLLDLMQ